MLYIDLVEHGLGQVKCMSHYQVLQVTLRCKVGGALTGLCLFTKELGGVQTVLLCAAVLDSGAALNAN